LIETPDAAARSWNLGPSDGRALSVKTVLESLASTWTRPNLEYLDNPAKEAQLLALDSTLARDRLGWKPSWDVEETIDRTAAWYRDFYLGEESGAAITEKQIADWRRVLLERDRGDA
jgi:CDP-glucose 4,6-dehydratase